MSDKELFSGSDCSNDDHATYETPGRYGDLCKLPVSQCRGRVVLQTSGSSASDEEDTPPRSRVRPTAELDRPKTSDKHGSIRARRINDSVLFREITNTPVRVPTHSEKTCDATRSPTCTGIEKAH